MRPLLDYISIFAASSVNIVSGFSLTYIGRAHTRLFSEMAIDLPVLSSAAVGYTATNAPVFVGFAVGLVTLVGLILIRRIERLRWMLPILLSLSFVFVVLHIIFVALASSLPLLRITYTMTQ
jgi:hypothetical protein